MVRRLTGLGLLSLVAFVVVQQGSVVATRSYRDEASLQAGSALRLAVSALSGHLRRFEALPALIADHETIRRLVAAPRDPTLRHAANLHLQAINTLLESSDIYVMTLDGDTIAASNFDRPTSFIGQNFSYRPYFQDAAKGSRSRFYGLGTTSLKRGYYFGAPVTLDGRIAGVIVFKVDVDSLETSWQGGEYKIFVSDPEGIIFMSGSEDWLYTGILPLTAERLARTQASRRYAEAPLSALPYAERVEDGHRLFTIAAPAGSREYLVLSHYMADADWTVHVLLDTGFVAAQVRTVTIAMVLLICLAGLALAIFLQRRARGEERLRLQMEARGELERRVAERTADLARVNTRIEQEIAERRMTEQELRRTQADLIQAGKLAGLGQMSAALSHEFNQPLTAAKTYADSAAMLIDRQRIAEARDNVQRISSLIDRLAAISRHLRNFARKPNERLGPVAVDAVIADTLEIVGGRLKLAGADLHISPPASGLSVLGGSVRLQQVLVNILTNAADAVEGLHDRRIDLAIDQDGDRVVIIMRDRGLGVPEAIAERIFDPFFTTKGVGKGLGLGLSISYNIVKDFGGSLSVANHPEGGAVFRLDLLAAVDREEAAQ